MSDEDRNGGISAGEAAGLGLGHVDKWRTQRRMDAMSMKPR